MAVMHPRKLPDLVSSDPRRSSEKKVYEALKTGVEDTYSVYFSVAWLAKPGKGQARDGEVDFVVAHPKHGVLMLEVKGGRIERHGLPIPTSSAR